MKIKSLQLQNFKRFTGLTIQDIPETAKLVLLIGSNGSGKSCVFEAFEAVNKVLKTEDISFDGEVYHDKRKSQPFSIHFYAEKYEQTKTISAYLNSNDPDDFYKSFSMKDFCKSLRERQNISPIDLSKTNWFKHQFEIIIQ